MIDFLLLILCTMLWIQGFNCLFSEGHLLEKVGDWMFGNLPEVIYKPTVGCPMCMSSLHGTVAYLIFANTGIYLWPVFCICLCGLNYVISKFTTKERIIIDDEDNR